VNELKRRTGLFFLLALYSLSIFFYLFQGSTQNQNTKFTQCEESIESAHVVTVADHGCLLDLHFGATKESADSGQYKDFKNCFDAFLSFIPFKFVSIDEVLILASGISLKFDQVDIIFPFHYFF